MDRGLGDRETSVLVVEDEQAVADVYREYLTPEFSVSVATDGATALERLDESIDVILLDRHMPGMSGDEVLHAIRDRGEEIPVALVTAVQPTEEILDLPFDEYVTKPVDRDALVTTVRVLANRTSFQKKSREFFSLAAKKATLETDASPADLRGNGYAELVETLTELRSELDQTVAELLGRDPEIRDRHDLEPDEVESLLLAVGDHSLPDPVEEIVDEYQRLRDSRPPFMWKWVHRLAPQNTLPCVDNRFQQQVPIDKTLLILFITILDDVLEKRGDQRTFRQLANIPRDGIEADPEASGVDAETVAFAKRVWRTIEERIESAPHYETYAELYRFDVLQAINAIEYSDIAIRRTDLATMDDLQRYESHNMVMHAYADIDLMHTSADLRSELPTLREAVWTAQRMARIGNWVSTWQRELAEGDFSAGPIVYALETGLISLEDLEAAPTDEAIRTSIVDRMEREGLEKEFLTRWERHYYDLRQYDDQLDEIDLEPYIEGLEEVLRYHLASTGLK